MSRTEGAPLPEFTDREKYLYIPRNVVTQTLETFGYTDPRMRWVDAMYISPDYSTGVGILQVTEERCSGHLGGVLRGVDQGEAIGQATLLLYHFTGHIPEGQKPMLRRIELDFENPAVPEVDLNLVVTRLPEENILGGLGRVLCGSTILTQGKVVGQIVSSEFLDKVIERRRRNQTRTTPLFPMQN